MYASLKEWINVPYQYRPFLKYNGAGVRQLGEPVDSICYPVGDTKFVTDVSGAQKGIYNAALCAWYGEYQSQ